MDGTDLDAKRRRTDQAADSSGNAVNGTKNTGDGHTHRSSHDNSTQPFDVSLERYEYAGVKSILNGAAGFAVTCAFNREKSATKEILELLRPHLPLGLKNATNGLGLNPVKMPGRGFVFVRLSARTCEKTEKDDDANTDSKALNDIYVFGHAAANACAATASSIRDGKTSPPRWVEKIIAVQSTCVCDEKSLTEAMPKVLCASLGSSYGQLVRGGESGMRRGDGVDAVDTHAQRVTAGANSGVTTGPTVEGEDDKNTSDEKYEKDQQIIKYAVSFTNRFKGHDDDSGETKQYIRNAVVPLVASAFERAIGGGDGDGDGADEKEKNPLSEKPKIKMKVDLKNPDFVVFVEVLSVPNESSGGSRSGGFTKRLAIGVATKQSKVFEYRRGGIHAVALKRAKA